MLRLHIWFSVQQIEAVIQSKDLDEDDETHREHTFALLHSYLLQACDQVESTGGSFSQWLPSHTHV